MMWKRLVEFRNVIMAVMAIISMTIGGTTYFVTASDFEGHKQEFSDYRTQQRLTYVDQTIAQFEDRRKCFQDECRRKMSDLEWDTFRKHIIERLSLEKQLFGDDK